MFSRVGASNYSSNHKLNYTDRKDTHLVQISKQNLPEVFEPIGNASFLLAVQEDFKRENCNHTNRITFHKH